MPRIRTIKPEFFSHEDLASKSAHARLLAIGLLTLADCEGRLRWVPMQVHSQVFPWEAEVKIELLLGELIQCNYVVHYEVDGKRYVEICNFKKHQRLSGKEASFDSRLPSPPIKPKKTLTETGEAEVKQSNASQGSGGNPLGTGEQGNRGNNNMSGFLNQTFLPSGQEPDIPFEEPPPKPKREYSDEFEQFWTAFPKTRRTKKGDAYRKWKIAIRSAEPAFLIKRAREYCVSEKGQGEYAVMPSVWLNGACWNDDDAAWNPSKVLSQQRSASRLPTAEDKANYNSGAY